MNPEAKNMMKKKPPEGWDPSKGFVIYEGFMIPCDRGFGATIWDGEEHKVYAGTAYGWISKDEFKMMFPRVRLPE